MRKLALLAALGLVLLLAGCFDYTEDLTLRSDGSASIKSDIAMASFMQSLMADPELPLGGEKEFEDGSGKMWTETKDGKFVTHLAGEIKDFRHSNTLAPSAHLPGRFEQKWYTIEPLGLGRYKLTRTVSLPGPGDDTPLHGNSDEAGGFAGAFGQTIADNMFAGHQFQVRLHAPLILSSNADTKDGLTSATWNKPLNQLAGPQGQPLTIEATVWLVDYRLAGLSLAGVVVLLVGGIALALRGRGKKRRATDMPTSA
jgi:hypothetical protein